MNDAIPVSKLIQVRDGQRKESITGNISDRRRKFLAEYNLNAVKAHTFLTGYALLSEFDNRYKQN